MLIERVRGLEDSSRYWSVWMTLDHLRIMNSRLGKVITSLAKGVIPPGKASTANVKPNKEVASSVVAEYETACDQLLAAVADVQNLKTRHTRRAQRQRSFNEAARFLVRRGE